MTPAGCWKLAARLIFVGVLFALLWARVVEICSQSVDVAGPAPLFAELVAFSALIALGSSAAFAAPGVVVVFAVLVALAEVVALSQSVAAASFAELVVVVALSHFVAAVFFAEPAVVAPLSPFVAAVSFVELAEVVAPSQFVAAASSQLSAVVARSRSVAAVPPDAPVADFAFAVLAEPVSVAANAGPALCVAYHPSDCVMYFVMFAVRR